MDDWTGNKKSTWAVLGASSHSKAEREKDDFYATDPAAVLPLYEVMGTSLIQHPVYEPACGQGHISEALKSLGAEVVSSDIIDRGYGVGGIDFLKLSNLPRSNFNIVTNPPYRYALEFVEHSLRLVSHGHTVAMFLKITFLEGIKRRSFFDRHPPHTVAVFSRRQTCAKNGDFSNTPPSAACYAWFIWRKGYNGKPTITWI